MGEEQRAKNKKIINLNTKMAHFRFMDLDIWKDSIALNDQLFDLSSLAMIRNRIITKKEN